MTEHKTRSRRGLKLLAIILSAFVLPAYFIFRLFEPVFVWNSGWQTLTNKDRLIGEQTAIPEGYADIILAANRSLDEAILTNDFPAVSVALGKNGALIWARAAGFRDIKNEVPVTLQTKFRIGSVSKAVTATTAARLSDEGVLDIDASIKDLVPYYPQKAFDITTRQLMTHTAGIRHYGPCLCFPFDEYSNQKHHDSVESAIGRFSKSALLFEPGTDFSYSSYGVTLASAAMEGASGQSFDSLIETKLTTPLGMKNTLREGLADGDFAVPYVIKDGQYKKAYPVDSSNKTAGGGFLSTPIDLILMTQAILTQDYVAPATRESLFYTPQKLATGEVNEQSYAFGWRSHLSTDIFDDGREVMISHHGGVAMGGIAFLIMYPEHDMSIAITVNRQMDGVGELWNLVHAIAQEVILRTEKARD
ncbi:hypothetical protein GCM10009069_15940 [Algimonas arctica]|uniref:Beta-lactamase-related domain-containing protein n=1 Tax=Algimonas arctica TaxID=1479486 RepID=A0A8J3CQ00_9PROT|nr:serine hydrolase domain-containing protein [Algimonas arctica]GHA93666.1 hypothetical protein GCM10009069_15940 [Algimonas arctica]